MTQTTKTHKSSRQSKTNLTMKGKRVQIVLTFRAKRHSKKTVLCFALLRKKMT